jgi:hypothetical protein
LGQLFVTIRGLVAEDKYVVGKHAAERLVTVHFFDEDW